MEKFLKFCSWHKKDWIHFSKKERRAVIYVELMMEEKIQNLWL